MPAQFPSPANEDSRLEFFVPVEYGARIVSREFGNVGLYSNDETRMAQIHVALWQAGWSTRALVERDPPAGEAVGPCPVCETEGELPINWVRTMIVARPRIPGWETAPTAPRPVRILPRRTHAVVARPVPG